MKAVAADTVVRPRKTPPPISTPKPKAFITPQDVTLSPAQAALEERLRAWRKEQARAAGLPSFFIFSDTVLREIVVAAPGSMAELRSVRGVGPEKLERFGAAVVEICHA